MGGGRLFLIIPFLAVLVSPPLGRDAAFAQTQNGGDVIRTFVDAINTGDTSTAMQLASPNLTLAFPTGQKLALSASTQLPAVLLPVRIVSLSPESIGSQTVDCVFTFGSDPTQQRVQIKGDGGVIISIEVLGPA